MESILWVTVHFFNSLVEKLVMFIIPQNNDCGCVQYFYIGFFYSGQRWWGFLLTKHFMVDCEDGLITQANCVSYISWLGASCGVWTRLWAVAPWETMKMTMTIIIMMMVTMKMTTMLTVISRRLYSVEIYKLQKLKLRIIKKVFFLLPFNGMAYFIVFALPFFWPL